MKNYRVLVSTDLGGDPDDIQSLYRLMHYSDILNIEGITSCIGPGSVPQAGLVREWIQRVDIEAMRDNGYPELMQEQALLDCVRQGATTPGAPSSERTTPGSQIIVERAMARNDEPLWVLVWGSITDVAQALHGNPDIASRIRINFISSSNREADLESYDYVYRFMEEQYPHLWWIENGRFPKWKYETFRGVYQGGSQAGKYANTAWIDSVVRGKGTTHGGMFEEKCGDAFPVAHYPRNSLKEGDSPTFLYLLSPVVGGVGDVDDPTQESWGGQFYRPLPQTYPNYFTDLDAEGDVCQNTIGTWRTAFLDLWEERWQRYPR
jgi:hypothetical protein